MLKVLIDMRRLAIKCVKNNLVIYAFFWRAREASTVQLKSVVPFGCKNRISRSLHLLRNFQN